MQGSDDKENGNKDELGNCRLARRGNGSGYSSALPTHQGHFESGRAGRRPRCRPRGLHVLSLLTLDHFTLSALPTHQGHFESGRAGRRPRCRPRSLHVLSLLTLDHFTLGLAPTNTCAPGRARAFCSRLRSQRVSPSRRVRAGLLAPIGDRGRGGRARRSRAPRDSQHTCATPRLALLFDSNPRAFLRLPLRSSCGAHANESLETASARAAAGRRRSGRILSHRRPRSALWRAWPRGRGVRLPSRAHSSLHGVACTDKMQMRSVGKGSFGARCGSARYRTESAVCLRFNCDVPTRPADLVDVCSTLISDSAGELSPSLSSCTPSVAGVIPPRPRRPMLSHMISTAVLLSFVILTSP
jgi:hypothetical protein